jgi:hypothetical protein
MRARLCCTLHKVSAVPLLLCLACVCIALFSVRGPALSLRPRRARPARSTRSTMWCWTAGRRPSSQASSASATTATCPTRAALRHPAPPQNHSVLGPRRLLLRLHEAPCSAHTKLLAPLTRSSLLRWGREETACAQVTLVQGDGLILATPTGSTAYSQARALPAPAAPSRTDLIRCPSGASRACWALSTALSPARAGGRGVDGAPERAVYPLHAAESGAAPRPGGCRCAAHTLWAWKSLPLGAGLLSLPSRPAAGPMLRCRGMRRLTRAPRGRSTRSLSGRSCCRCRCV